MEHPVISSFDPSKLFLPQYLLSERGHKPHQRCAIPHHGWRISPIFMVCLIYSFVRWGKAERSLIRLHIEAIQQTYRGISFYGCGNKSFLLIPPKKAEKLEALGMCPLLKVLRSGPGWVGSAAVNLFFIPPVPLIRWFLSSRAVLRAPSSFPPGRASEERRSGIVQRNRMQ